MNFIKNILKTLNKPATNHLLLKIILTSILSFAIFGCMNGSTTPTNLSNKQQYAYVPNEYSYTYNGYGSVSMYKISESGLLIALDESTVSAQYSPTYVALDKSGKHAYVINNDGANGDVGSVSMYNINDSGILESFGQPVLTQYKPHVIAITPNNKFAYVVNQNGQNNNFESVGSVSLYTIDQSGALNPQLESSVATEYYPQTIAIAPNGKFAYAVNSGGDGISGFGSVSMYNINDSGLLIPLKPASVPTQYQPVGICIDKTSSHVYVTNSSGNDYNESSSSTISIYDITNSGTLVPHTPESFVQSQFGSLGITLDPRGKYAYVTNLSDTIVDNYGYGTVSMYNVTESGFLVPLQESSIEAQSYPIGVTVDPSGKFAYVVNAGGENETLDSVGTVSMYSISESGLLSPLSKPTVTTEIFPLVVTTTNYK